MKQSQSKLFCFFCLISLMFFPFSSSADTESLEKISKGFSAVGKKAIPSVVFIKAKMSSGNELGSLDEADNPFDCFNDEFFRRFFKQSGRTKGKPPAAQVTTGGSGFIVGEEGYVLTNYHVIREASQITVVFNTGEEYEATIIGSDPKTDLAVIKIDAKKLPCLCFGNSETLEIGELVVAIGSPFALQASLTTGVVSAKGRQNLKITDLEDFIQTDAAINPGNSGGPLLNLKGEVIGINTAIMSGSGGYMGIGFAIPSNMAKHVMEQIIQNGSVKRGFLGVYLQSLDKELAKAMNLEKAEGALVADVPKDSPGEKGGLKQGDVIVAYNKIPVKDVYMFRKEISLLDPGTTLHLKVLREGSYKELSVTLKEAPDEQLSANSSFQLGIEVTELKNLTPEALKQWNYAASMEGLFVTAVKGGSLGEKAGLLPGMVVLQVNQKKVKTSTEFFEELKVSESKKYVLLLVKQQNATKFVAIRLK